MKEQMWFTNVINLWLSLNTSWALVFYVDTHVCAILKVIDIHKK